MTEMAISRDAVAIDEAVHDIYKQLTEGNDPVGVPFRTMKDVFMWAACLGQRMGERRPLTGKRLVVFRWAQFTPQTDIHLLKALAIADSGDVNVLLGQDEILSIAEEYANAGIYELRASVLDEYGQPLWNLVSISTSKT
jgi:dnd system-associated protein 4